MQGTWRELLDALPDAACVVDGGGRILFANRRLLELTGYVGRASLEGRELELLVPEPQRAAHRRAAAGYVRRPSPRAMGEGRPTSCRRADGSVFAVDIALSPLQSGEGGPCTIAVLRDATERQRTEQELFRQATHDPLTGLANRALLLDRLDGVRRRRSRHGRPLTLLFVDLDHFKAVNDTDGHAAGDHVLREVASALTATFRPGDTVARVGGDEFVVVCEDTPLDEAASLAQRAVDAVRSQVQALPYAAAGRVTASVGAVGAGVAEGDESLIARADAAMYGAKQRGGDQLLVA